jgi:hypothetical protein
MFRLLMDSFDLWMCISSVELETHSNGRVLSIEYVMMWTSHVDSKYGYLSSYPWLCYFCLDGHCYFLSYYRCYMYYYSYAIT